jgi:predicted nucleic acid-binding Zn ribbon protein
VIVLDQAPEHGRTDLFGFVGLEDTLEMQERRRNILLRELHRVQRASFIHFLILCLIPTCLLVIVIATVLGQDDECNSEATTCTKEARTFINAFTTRCVCEAIKIATGEN